jgi:hypothetical protein
MKKLNRNKNDNNYRQENRHQRNYERSEEVLRFLKYKNTPPPQDLQPKKLKYENYYNYNFYENAYNNFNSKHINILTPTPLKNEQVNAGNVNINDNFYSRNNDQKFGNNRNTSDNYLYRQPPNEGISKINYNKFDNNDKFVYKSKYPVELSIKKKNEEKNSYNINFSRSTFGSCNDNNKNNLNQPKAYENVNNNYRNYQNEINYINNISKQPSTLNYNYQHFNRNAPTNNFISNSNLNNLNDPPQNYMYANNRVSYKVINAQDYLKSQNKLKGDESNVKKNNVLSVSPIGPLGLLPNYNYNRQEYFKPNPPIADKHDNFQQVIIDNQRRNLHNQPYPVQNDFLNNINAQQPHQTNQILQGSTDEKIVPRKLRFSNDGTNYNKFNVTNKKVKNKFY